MDGFCAAEILRSEKPDSFECLATTTFRYRSVDSTTGWHLEASGAIIDVDRASLGEPVMAVRHNDLDRVGCLPPYAMRSDTASLSSFYSRVDRALKDWDDVITSEVRECEEHR